MKVSNVVIILVAGLMPASAQIRKNDFLISVQRRDMSPLQSRLLPRGQKEKQKQDARKQAMARTQQQSTQQISQDRASQQRLSALSLEPSPSSERDRPNRGQRSPSSDPKSQSTSRKPPAEANPTNRVPSSASRSQPSDASQAPYREAKHKMFSTLVNFASTERAKDGFESRFRAAKEREAHLSHLSRATLKQQPMSGAQAVEVIDQRRKEAAAKAKAKSARAELDAAHREAYQTFAVSPIGTHLATSAVDKAVKASEASTAASNAHIDALKTVSESFVAGKHYSLGAKYLRATQRAHSRRVVRESHEDAVHNAYIAAASRKLSREYGRNDPARPEAINNAVILGKKYEASVKEYRGNYRNYKTMGEEWSGSDTEESEKEFGDVKKD